MQRIAILFPAVCSPRQWSQPSDSQCRQDDKLQQLVKLLEPFDTATEKVSSPKQPTVGLIKPMLYQMTQLTLAARDDAIKLIADCKAAILADLGKWYQEEEQKRLLSVASALDSCFKHLSWLDDSEKDEVYSEVETEAIAIGREQEDTIHENNDEGATVRQCRWFLWRGSVWGSDGDPAKARPESRRQIQDSAVQIWAYVWQVENQTRWMVGHQEGVQFSEARCTGSNNTLNHLTENQASELLNLLWTVCSSDEKSLGLSSSIKQGGSRTTCLACFRDHILLQSL